MVTSIATWGGKRLKSWWAQSGPGGRPSMGPSPPPRPRSTACCVWFDCSVGTGFSAETGCRGSTSRRGIGWVNLPLPIGPELAPGAPVGMATPPPPPPPDARACVATRAVTIDAHTPYKMHVRIRLVFETLLPPRFIFGFPLQFVYGGLVRAPAGRA